MKKLLFTLAFIVASLSSWAASFELYFGDKPVINGGSYETGYTIDYQDEWGISYKQDANLYLHVTPGTNVTMTVSTDNPVQFCGITGQCAFMKAGETITREGVIYESFYNTQLDKFTDLDNGQDPTAYLKVINLTVTVYETGNPNGSTTVYVKLNNIPQSMVSEPLNKTGMAYLYFNGELVEDGASYETWMTGTVDDNYNVTYSQAAEFTISGDADTPVVLECSTNEWVYMDLLGSQYYVDPLFREQFHLSGKDETMKLYRNTSEWEWRPEIELSVKIYPVYQQDKAVEISVKLKDRTYEQKDVLVGDLHYNLRGMYEGYNAGPRKFGNFASVVCFDSSSDYANNGDDCPEVVTIPDEIEYDGMTFSVIAIEPNAFKNCKGLKEVVMAESIEDLGRHAFENCDSLKAINLSVNLKTLGSMAFANCASLNEVVIPKGVRYYETEGCSLPNDSFEGNLAFYNCTSLEKVRFEDGCEKIGQGMFYGCPNLWNIVLPASLREIPYYAFRSYSGLNLTIPASVERIESEAFYGATGTLHFVSATPTISNVNSSTFPKSMVLMVPKGSVGAYRTAWPDYEYQIIEEGKTEFDITVTAKSDDSAVLRAIIGSNSSEYVYNVVSLKVRGTINSYDIMIMRNKMVNLQHLDLSEARIVANPYEYYEGYPSENDVLGPYSFYEVDNLISVKLPKSIYRLGRNAFGNCQNLKNVEFGDNIEEIESECFHYCLALQSVVLPKELKQLGYEAFGDCYNLKEVVFPKNLRRIGDYAFWCCYSLGKIDLPNRLEYIDYYAFAGCSNLKEVNIPAGIKHIGDYAFDTNSIRTIRTWTIIPTSINQNTFNSELYTKANLVIPEFSENNYYWDTEWSQFLQISTFYAPYDYAALNGEIVFDDETKRIEGEDGQNPDVDINSGAGLVVNGDASQDLGEVNVEVSFENPPVIIGGNSDSSDSGCNINIDNLNISFYVEANRWYFMCMPFNVAISDIEHAGQCVWRYYDGIERAMHGFGGWKDAVGMLEKATGYIFSSSTGGSLTIRLDKVSFGGDDEVVNLETYSSANAQDASWNLVGNPYMCYYKLSDLGYTCPITVWNGYNYEAYNPMDDQYMLHPFEAFFVQKTASQDGMTFYADGRLTYSQSQESLTGNRFAPAKTTNADRNIVNLEVTNGVATDRTRIVFNDARSINYEIECDAAKFMSKEAPQIYTLDSKNVKYAINERPEATGIVPLGFSTAAAGTFTLSATRSDRPVWLKDLSNGAICDLSTESYEFNAEAGDTDSRFLILTSPECSGIDAVEAAGDASTYFGVNGVAYGENGKNLNGGVVIRKTGNKVEKVVNK